MDCRPFRRMNHALPHLHRDISLAYYGVSRAKDLVIRGLRCKACYGVKKRMLLNEFNKLYIYTVELQWLEHL